MENISQEKTDYRTQGTANELAIAEYLQNKKVKDLNDHWKPLIKKMFPNCKEKDLIKSWRHYDHMAKPDIKIRVGKDVINLSIKTGKIPSIHKERTTLFFKFLEANGVSKRTIHIINFFHYGRTWKKSDHGRPYTKEKLIKEYNQYFTQANAELNSNKELLRKIAMLCFFEGNDDNREKADFLYYGVVDKGILFSQEEVVDIISRDVSNYKRGIHYGGLIHNPCSRNPKEIDNCNIRFKWPMLAVLFYDNDPDKYIKNNLDLEKAENNNK